MLLSCLFVQPDSATCLEFVQNTIKVNNCWNTKNSKDDKMEIVKKVENYDCQRFIFMRENFVNKSKKNNI